MTESDKCIGKKQGRKSMRFAGIGSFCNRWVKKGLIEETFE